MFDEKITPEQEALLRSQVFDDLHPGPVLHDFRVVLDHVGTQGVPAGGKYNMLPITAIPALDPRLAHPLRLPLERPQLKSHPYLQGLHLLLRATGLGRVQGRGDKARLYVDPDTLEAWNRLNPTEQYGALLEAWLLDSRGEMVGERGRDWGNCIGDVSLAWREIPAKGRTFDPEGRGVFLCGIYGKLYHLALMDLFGLVAIEQLSKPVAPWCPARVDHTPFGDALFPLLVRARFAELFAEDDEDVEDEELEDGEGSSTGQLQQLLQPYFPAWQNSLVPGPAGEYTPGVYIFKVSLGKVWRKIAVRDDQTLHDLVGAILDSVDFDDDHLYQFEYRDPMGKRVTVGDPRARDEDLSGDEFAVGELPLEPGDTMHLTYDFGDNWEFQVKLERIDPPGSRKKLPAVVEKHGKAPEQYPEWD